jgi:hypothetical protein
MTYQPWTLSLTKSSKTARVSLPPMSAELPAMVGRQTCTLMRHVCWPRANCVQVSLLHCDGGVVAVAVAASERSRSAAEHLVTHMRAVQVRHQWIPGPCNHQGRPEAHCWMRAILEGQCRAGSLLCNTAATCVEHATAATGTQVVTCLLPSPDLQGLGSMQGEAGSGC